jgi:tRNA (cmo5U34)-methyltransferase
MGRMPEPAAPDTNAAIWKSDAAIQNWLAGMDERERKRAEQFEFMAQLLPFEQDAQFTLLDLGAGTGAAARAIMSFYPRAQAILADFSPQMMGAGLDVLRPFEGRYRYVELDMLADTWPAGIPARVDAAVTSQCVHHLDDEHKQNLFRLILQHLPPGGWYVNFDPIAPPDARVGSEWERVNDRLDPALAHKRTHRSSQEQAQYENHVRYMIDLDLQLGFLKSAGFEAVDVYWKKLDYVIYGGKRPAA